MEEKRNFNYLSVISFELSIVSVIFVTGFSVLSLILGIMSLIRINKYKEKGKEFAIVSILISIFVIITMILNLAL